MDAFLTRFLTAVDDYLGDPTLARRYPQAKKLRDLRRIEVQIWEKLMRSSGQESTIARVEHEITLQDDVAFYALPGNFRQFLGFERRQDGDRSNVIERYESISMYDNGPGVEILDARQGMLVRPTPRLDADQTWTMVYMKGPIPLHYGTAQSVTSTTLVGAATATAGEFILLPNFYSGALVHVYSATAGAGQTRVVSSFDESTKTFTLRDAWNPTPTGTVLYEIAPALPEPYDDLYALDVAIGKCVSLGMFDQKGLLIQDRQALWDACRAYYAANVADRMPRRSARLTADEVDPYECN